MSGDRHYPTSRTREVINKHNIGEGRKGRKSQLHLPEESGTKIKYPTFKKTVKLSWNSKTNDHRKLTSVTIPSNFWKTELSQKYSGLAKGSFLKIEISNPRFNLSGIHISVSNNF